MRKALILLTLFALACLPAQRASALLEVEAYFWYMLPDGTIAVGSGGRSGTTLDLETDLGYADYEGVPGLTVVVGDRHQVGLNYFSMELSSSDRVRQDSRFGPLTFPGGSKVSSDFEAEFARGFYRYDMGSSFARGGLIAGGQYMDFSARLSSASAGQTTEEMTAVIPIVGVYFVGHPLPFFGFRGSAVGSRWDIGDVEAAFMDIEFGAELTFLGGFFAAGGYRYVTIDATYDEDNSDVDVALSGPMVYVGFEW
jgi:hypothetical protein